MRILVVLTETPNRNEALCFARQTADKTGGSQTLLAVSPEPAAADKLRLALSVTLSPEERSVLKIRSGHFFPQVLAEIREGNFDLAVIGADPSPLEDSPHVTPAAHLARLCEIPLAIVRSCPQEWKRALICIRGMDSTSPTMRGGRDFVQRFGIQPTVLHVTPPTTSAPEPSADATGIIQVRHGPLVREIQREVESKEYDFVVIGPHLAPSTREESGPTLAQPDFAYQIVQLALPVVIVMGRPVVSKRQPTPASRSAELRRIVRFVAIELLIYAGLVVTYAAVAFHFLGTQLDTLFKKNLTLYAIIALVLIVGQGVLLEQLTSFLLNRLRLERFE